MDIIFKSSIVLSSYKGPIQRQLANKLSMCNNSELYKLFKDYIYIG